MILIKSRMSILLFLKLEYKLNALLQQSIPEPVFYGVFVYKLKKCWKVYV